MAHAGNLCAKSQADNAGGVNRNINRSGILRRTVIKQRDGEVDSRRHRPLPRRQLLQTQDDIATRLANALDAELIQAESRRPPLAGTQLDAEELAMLTRAKFRSTG